MSNNTQQVSWRSPSNIALIKYWGKKGHQIPSNASLSYTLDQAYTDMSLEWTHSSGQGIDLDFYFEDQPNEKFKAKIEKFLTSLLPEMPWLQEWKLTIRSSNSFPHSTGIASSASSMSALALCLCTMKQELFGKLQTDEEFFQNASHLARLGSGSAARSVYGGITVWGEVHNVPGSSEEFAVPLVDGIDPQFLTFHDSVLIVSRDEKAVSSRAGHALMNGHPYAEARYANAQRNMDNLIYAMQIGNMEQFIKIVESEALELHALMMISDPSVVLFKPNTWEIINRLRTFREETGYNVCFTLDAGPNVHVLYPDAIKDEVESFINEQLIVYCDQNYRIADRVGKGPVKM